MANPRQIGALWQRSYIDRRTGEVKDYFSGVLNFLGEPIPIVVFKNDNKEVDAQPDYLILRSSVKYEEPPHEPPVKQPPPDDY